MGQGSNLELINATPYDWVRTAQHSYQMNDWNFPTVVPAHTSVGVYVEWDQGLFTTEKHDGGEVRFNLTGTTSSFQLQARAPGKHFNLLAYIDEMATTNNPQGSTISLGWDHNGNSNFILAGEEGSFFSVNPPTNWMQATLDKVGDRTLRRLCIPGSHDAGMYHKEGSTLFADKRSSLTQKKSIGEQLSLGARYFDTRPVISSGKYKTGHYSDVSVFGWQGANGESFADIIADVNAFTENNKELVIIDINHDLNTDVGRDYRAMTQDEYNGLLDELKGLRHLYIAPDPTNVDLTNLTLNQFIGGGEAAVVVILKPENGSLSLTDYLGQGFYADWQFSVFNSYTDRDSPKTMARDQLTKLWEERTEPDSQMFLLSWTLTQNSREAIFARIHTSVSILDLAGKADNNLYQVVMKNLTSQVYPNIIFKDKYDSGDTAALAMAINYQFGSAAPPALESCTDDC